jgi:predicted metal-binding membrane protein
MGSSAPDLTRQVLRHERALLACTLLLLTGFGWAFLLRGMPMGSMQPTLTALIAMWWLMMLAMMLPSATPAILLYARVREVRGSDSSIAPPWVFFGGYLAIWLLFSIAAAIAQSLLTDSSAAIRSHAVRSALLIAAGLYQFCPLKSACVSQCRSPAQFISRHWRSGWRGAMRLGVLHGAYCVGCCWLLMGLLFAGGVMNLLWVVGLTLLVASEKLLPNGLWLQRISGVAFILWGVREVVA